MSRPRLTQERIDDIVKRYRPRGWRVRQSKHRWEWSSASANPSKRTLYVPTLDDADALYLYLHEAGHVRLGHFEHDIPAHREEFAAEHFAVHTLRTENVCVTKLMIKDAKYRVRLHIDADIKKGIPIQRHIARWAGHKSAKRGRKASG
jgi:hypothetical protein